MNKEYETPKMEIIFLERCIVRTSNGGDEYDNWETWPTQF